MSKRVQEIKNKNKEQIIERYSRLEDMKEIALSIGVSGTTVKNWLVEWGVHESGSRIEKTVCSLFLSGMNIPKIESEVGISNSGVRRILKANGIYKNKRSVNHDALSNLLDGDSLYWIGFICGDGCIWDGGKTPALQIASKDIDIIKKFKKFFRSNHKVTKNIHRKNGGEFYRIGFTSQKICDVLKNIGITQNKTHSLEITKPEILSSSDFIRGLIDADGHISKLGRSIEITTGSKAFSEQVCQSIKENGFACSAKTRNREGRKVYYTIKINGGVDAVKSFILWLGYENANYCLNRKKETALKITNG
jgi:DNA-binding transcriptional regulator WhiA